MKKFLVASAAWGGLGLVAGLYYRALTSSRDFTGVSQLGLVHGHLLALGMVANLLLVVVERSFGFVGTRLGGVAFWLWQLGLGLTAGTMLVKGSLTVLGRAFSEPAVAGVAGLGHMVMTAAVVALFVSLFRALPREASTRA